MWRGRWDWLICLLWMRRTEYTVSPKVLGLESSKESGWNQCGWWNHLMEEDWRQGITSVCADGFQIAWPLVNISPSLCFSLQWTSYCFSKKKKILKIKHWIFVCFRFLCFLHSHAVGILFLTGCTCFHKSFNMQILKTKSFFPSFCFYKTSNASLVEYWAIDHSLW